MDFTSALLYPYRSVAKVLTIVLITTIACAVFLGMLLNSFDWIGFIQALQYNVSLTEAQYRPASDFLPYGTPSGTFIPAILGLLAVMLAQTLWLSGYGIRVIRSVMDGHEKLPTVQVGKDMMTGLSLFVANIVYALLFVPLFILVGMLMAMTSGNSSGLPALLFCGSFFIAIPLMILMGWAYFIGMARSAADDNRGALFQIGTNLRIARQNVKLSASLTGYLILLALTFGFVSQFASNILQVFTKPFLYSNQDQTSILIAILIPMMLSIAMNIVQEFSKMHMIAQYGTQLGLNDDFEAFSRKNDDIDFDFD